MQTTRSRLKIFSIAAAVLLLSACSHTGSYNSSYFEYAPQPVAEKITGSAAIEMSREAQAATFTGKPTSFTGGGTTLTLPLGQIVKEASVLAFRDMFTDGIEVVEAVPPNAPYTMTIRPQVRSFSYEYNQLKNVGFAITPTAVVAIEVSAGAPGNPAAWTQVVDSGTVEGPAYFVTGAPGEEIAKVAHKAVLKTLQKAAASAYEKMRDVRTPAQPDSSSPGGVKL